MTAELPTDRPSVPRSDRLIYVVDDQAMIGEFVEVILKLEGFEPKFFLDPETAFKAFLKESPRPALLLTDFLMPFTNGMELIARCKAIDPGLKTILYSGNVSEEIVENYTVHPDGFLKKPFLPSAAIQIVRSVLQGRSALGASQADSPEASRQSRVPPSSA